jgi:acyl-CoA reductase-like NAD-dependent aldehyde dehydrogenase
MAQALDTPNKPLVIKRGSIKFPELEGDIRRSSKDELDTSIVELNSRKDAWVSLPVEERMQILDEIMEGLLSVSQDWVDASLQANGAEGNVLSEGVEFGSFWPMLRTVRLVRKSLQDIQKSGKPSIPGKLWARPNGQVVANVFPQTLWERLLFLGISGDVWMDPEMSVNEVLEKQAAIYSDGERAGKVSVVLGAGNVGFLAFAQVIHKLFFQLEVVALKLNPVNAYLGPLFERGLQSLIKRGFLRIVYGAGEEGTFLVHHSMVDAIHMIGSDKTYEAIMFGPGTEGVERKANREPLLTKSFEAELGNVSPVIVVPGPWSEGDLNYVAKQMASWQVFNSGFYCLTPRVIIQKKGWEHRQELLRRIGDVLSTIKPAKAYYPGAKRIHQVFMDAHPDALTYGTPEPDQLPWTLIPDVDAAHHDDIAFTTEAFCSLTAETALEAEGIPEYLRKAVTFANENLWGTLCATIIVHSKAMKDPLIAAAIDKAIEDLRYGTVCLNYFPGIAACFAVLPWGGYPHDNIYDIQSGIGPINNSLMFERPQKAVLRAPFRRFPDPYLATARNLNQFTKKLAHFDAKPSIWKLPGLLISAFQS